MPDVDSGAVALLIVLLLGSMTAGILFVSPLGSRYRSARDGGGQVQPRIDKDSSAEPGRESNAAKSRPAPSAWSTGHALSDERYRPPW